jgi:hypothetical protein
VEKDIPGGGWLLVATNKTIDPHGRRDAEPRKRTLMTCTIITSCIEKRYDTMSRECIATCKLSWICIWDELLASGLSIPYNIRKSLLLTMWLR